MKQFYILFIFFVIININISAQPCLPQTTRVLLVGDSWTNYMWNDKTYRNVFDYYGRSEIVERGDFTAIAGTTADFWAASDKLNVITTDLLLNPSIDIVVLSIGGNDIFGQWNKNMTATQTTTLLNTIENNIVTIINAIKNVRPEIEIVFSGYDFINLTETVLANPTSANGLLWNNLGLPSIVELNTIFSQLEQRKINLANADERVYYVNSMGLMQYIYGYPTALPVAPYGTFAAGSVPFPGNAPPDYAPFPGGDINYPSPTVAMASNGTDGVHLSTEGYWHLVNNQYQNYFKHKFNEIFDTLIYSEGNLNEGWTTASEANANEYRLGNNHKALLSFNTSELPDNSVATKATLVLQRSGQSGIIPLDLSLMGTCVLEIKNGYFGDLPELEPQDYSALADASVNACFYGSAKQDDAWIRIELAHESLGYINPSGLTQFRMSAENASEYLAFAKGNASLSSGSYLELDYDIVNELEDNLRNEFALTQNCASLYPNPANDLLTVQFSEQTAQSVELLDFSGKRLVLHSTEFGVDNTKLIIDISDLASGMYVAKAKIADGCFAYYKFVKR